MVNKIQADLYNKNNYSGSETFIIHLLKVLSFKYKYNNGPQLLLELRGTDVFRVKFFLNYPIIAYKGQETCILFG